MARRGMATMGLAAMAGLAQAGTLELTVTKAGAGVEHAVASLHPLGDAPPAQPAAADMDQKNLQFVPRVLAITAGSEVRFPNSDKLRHQVYSFSKAKTFDLPLYSGHPAAPVRFDTAGVVELGCNIHDGMIGYIVVLDTPHHAVTDAQGRARLEAPAGEYRLQVWHEGLAADAPPLERAIHLDDGTQPLVLDAGRVD